MKILSILAAASLALTPVIASAGSSGDSANYDRPIAGPLAAQHEDDQDIPVGAIIIGGLVVIGGMVIALIGGDNNSNIDTTIDTTIGTNNGTN